MIRPRFVSFVALLTLIVAVGACGGQTAVAKEDAGSTRADTGTPVANEGGDEASVSDAGSVASTYLTSTLCGQAADSLTFGSPGEPVSTGGGDGDLDRVTCSVRATSATTYAIDLTVSGEFGAVLVSGTLDYGSASDARAAQGAITGTFAGMSGDYMGRECTLSLSTERVPAIAPGRIAATLTCPPADAGCGATATFIFQNCTE